MFFLVLNKNIWLNPGVSTDTAINVLILANVIFLVPIAICNFVKLRGLELKLEKWIKKPTGTAEENSPLEQEGADI
jgi:hypothetical protein